MATAVTTPAEIKLPINLNSPEFNANKHAYYKWLREHAPVYQGKVSIISAYLLSRYDDCVALLKDPRFVRNRSTATGGRRFPIPLPKSIAAMAQSMITEDEPAHRRLRGLVQQAFTPGALEKLEGRIEQLTHELLDRMEYGVSIDLIEAYSLPIPVWVIGEMMGVAEDDMPRFRSGMSVLTKGFSKWRMFRTLLWDMPRLVRFIRGLIERKRSNPGDDILTGLIQAEEQGDQLSQDELVSMVLLLIFAGHETTVHLITNGVATLLEHPDQLARLRAEPELIDSAVEEILRFNGPIQSTKPNYATADVTLRGVTIPKGSTVLPLLGSANRDPEVFDDPDVFDIARSPNRHLAFGHGIHYCLGAPLARIETRIALLNLLERSPNLRLAVEPAQLELQLMPMWHRYQSLPVVLE